MTLETLLALMTFALVSSITPGPNNLMVLASGANFGIRRTVPHLLGISLGHAFMVLLLGLGLGQVFVTWPVFHTVLKIASVAYMGWLAWKIANAAAPEGAETEGRPFTFLQAAAFQWVNPKAWVMGVTAVTVYTAPGAGALGAVLVAAAFCATNFPSVSIWAWMGTQVARWLSSPGRLRVFNWSMAVLLMASLVPILLG
ncbi:LysE family translocator [Dinoroseobacter sp. S375]|uniref:LysE family translocator n=1 Tax=Dinoroseobacter sp. S375 TaxID=3415136 RepID=UPI003C7A6D57